VTASFLAIILIQAENVSVSDTTMKLCIALTIALAATLPACAGHASLGASPPASESGGVLHQRHWQDEDGRTVAIDDYRGRPFVVTEVYTSCEVRCPMTLDTLRKMDAALQSRGVAASFILVTLDPRTDTPERLRRWKAARNLPATFHLLSGTEQGARELSRYLAVNAAYDQGHIDHDVGIALFDAQGHETRRYGGWSIDAEDAANGARGIEGARR